MKPRALRIAIGVVTALALAAGLFLPGSLAWATGAILASLLPFHVRTRPGGPHAARGGGDAERWFTASSRAGRVDTGVRISSAIAWVLYALGTTSDEPLPMGAVSWGLAGLGLLTLTLFGTLAMAGSRELLTDSVTLERETLTLDVDGALHVFRYADLVDVQAGGDGRVWFVTKTDRHGILSADPGPLLAAVEQAKRRAAEDANRAKTEAVELRRPAGMSTREWIGRLDALAAASRDHGAYRGAVLDDTLLWTLLRDDTEGLATRAAAARVLARAGGEAVRVRVAEAAELIADAKVRTRVMVATEPDADTAAAELEALELDEMKRDLEIS